MNEESIAVAELEGELLRDASSFPYLALVAFEVGGVLRLLLLLVLLPLAAAMRCFVSEAAGEKLMIFAAVAGANLADLQSAARAVLPKFFAAELRLDSWKLFNACGWRWGQRCRRCVVTAIPRIMAEVFLKDYLGADMVIGTELGSFMGRATGFVLPPGVLAGGDKEKLIRRFLGDSFVRLSQKALSPEEEEGVAPVRFEKLPKPVVFHDGRLVQQPTPMVALLIVLWFPVGFALAFLRVAAGTLFPMPLLHHIFRLLGVRITVHGQPPPPSSPASGGGSLFICNHRTLLDPIFLSAALRRPIAAVTFSISRLSELLSPIRTGTTCREPFLLRFSSLFAELAGDILPVAVASSATMFHGTTARGWKGMDPFFFFMNPRPAYEITFLGKLPPEMSCAAGSSGHEVANYVQRLLAAALSYECTALTRRDKYRVLAGNDGGAAAKDTSKAGTMG
ncbi:unnamed protein product [Spirodela intermedia]|uniref:Glycerol-3-phosphate acyltransferase RAM2/GPAT1-8 HAD-like domain-containing protein n=1 Tax=Spirodela intermedia TaxID=51605 RepID=A0A7I8I869_SPIIN|nr:unnamed protein product [Spirodela intermedia]CAA6653664.1 unnamed protein product [Spirodela intermedia]